MGAASNRFKTNPTKVNAPATDTPYQKKWPAERKRHSADWDSNPYSISESGLAINPTKTPSRPTTAA